MKAGTQELFERNEKKAYTAPQLSVYGTVEQITLQIKNKEWGPSDDVLIQQQQLLHDASSF